MNKLITALFLAIFKRVEKLSRSDMEIMLDIQEGSYSFPENKKFRGKNYMLSYGDNLFRVRISPDQDLPDGNYKLKSFRMQYVCWFGRFCSEPTIDYTLA